jgi:hypothetical protein
MRKRYREINDDDLLQHGQRLRVPMFAMDSMQRSASPRLLRVHDGNGDSGFHRPGFRVSDAPPSDELQIAREDYLHDLTTAYRRGAGKDVVPDAPRAAGNDATPVDDIETAYRLYAEEISEAWKTPR